MRRQTLHKSPHKQLSGPARRREQEHREEAARPRPEVREDVRRTWWPEG